MLPVVGRQKTIHRRAFSFASWCHNEQLPRSPVGVGFMRNEGVLTWEDIEKVGVGAVVVSIVGTGWAYVRSVGNKVDKSTYEQQIKEMRAEYGKQLEEMRKEFTKELETLSRRHSAWESRSERFATREMVDALNGRLDKIETRIDQNFEKLNTRLDKLIEARQ